MIVVRLQGGLGNQLFQYSLGKAHSQRTGLPVKLDISSYAQDPLRKLELSSFRAEWVRATPLESSRLRFGVSRHLLAKLTGRAPSPRDTYVKEKSHRFDSSILDVRGNAYLDGYWQSEKYFRAAEQELRKELVPKAALPPRLENLAVRIRGCEAISVHVRRGDYLSNPVNRAMFHVCEAEYYKNSAEHLISKVSHPRFFVFSEDLEWVRDVLLPALGEQAEAVPAGNDPLHDLYLMSCCRHYIIANSSFSWWGAWLNPGKEKIVMAPRLWFKQASQDSGDMIPESWNRFF